MLIMWSWFLREFTLHYFFALIVIEIIATLLSFEKVHSYTRSSQILSVSPNHLDVPDGNV